jgi:hypothetical protein
LQQSAFKPFIHNLIEYQCLGKWLGTIGRCLWDQNLVYAKDLSTTGKCQDKVFTLILKFSGQRWRRGRQLAAFKGLSGGPDRYARLARRAHLAQSAAIAREPHASSNIRALTSCREIH